MDTTPSTLRPEMTPEKKLERMMIVILATAIVIGVASVVIGMIVQKKAGSQKPTVTSFEECGALYPVMESYPRQCRTPDGIVFVESVPLPPDMTTMTGTAADLLRNVTPKPGDLVNPPLSISGEARLMYFEGSFPIEITDENANVIAQGIATAQGDWMTEEYVPFTATLTWSDFPTTPNGFLILKKDNPSGLPENDREASIPIRFGVSVEQSSDGGNSAGLEGTYDE